MSSLPLTITVKHQGRSLELTITRCKVFMASEFAGNVDLSLDCDPSLEPIIQESLHLLIPGEEGSVALIASGGPDDGVMLCFHCDAIEHLDRIPESLTFLWCDEPVASVAPELAESVPIEEVVPLLDPLELLGRSVKHHTENVFRLGVERELIWLLLAAMVGGLGATLCFAELDTKTSQVPFIQVGGGLLLLVGIAMAVVICWIPKRQIWYDRATREVVILEGRTLSPENALPNAKRHSSDGYAHVRLCEREYAPDPMSENGATQTDYLVSLEGPIPYAFDDGRVHSRSDALHIACFKDERTARRVAAELAYHAGLKVLIATDW